MVGFTVPGRILWQAKVNLKKFLMWYDYFDLREETLFFKGQGVNGAEVFINDKFSSQTNQNGDYLLERMSAGKYKITAKREGVEFTSVEVELSPKNHRIPDVVASK